MCCTLDDGKPSNRVLRLCVSHRLHRIGIKPTDYIFFVLPPAYRNYIGRRLTAQHLGPCARNNELPALSLHFLNGRLQEGLIGGSIFNLCIEDQEYWCLCLCMKRLDCQGTKPNARHQRQRSLTPRCHGNPPCCGKTIRWGSRASQEARYRA